jgi:type II restriction enzyme
MEAIVEAFIQDLCKEKGYSYLKEANAEKILKEYEISVPVDKSSRRYDFVVKTHSELVIFEVNFYGGGGSKLKSTAGEYRYLYSVLDNQFKFIWITDGLGWNTASRPLRETFSHNDYVLSLAMLEKDILSYII